MKVFADWNCSTTGWMNVNKEDKITYFQHAIDQQAPGMSLDHYVVTFSSQPIYNYEKDKIVGNLTVGELDRNSFNNLSHISITETTGEVQNGWIPIYGSYGKPKMIKADNVYIIRWISHQTGD